MVGNITFYLNMNAHRLTKLTLGDRSKDSMYKSATIIPLFNISSIQCMKSELYNCKDSYSLDKEKPQY